MNVTAARQAHQAAVKSRWITTSFSSLLLSYYWMILSVKSALLRQQEGGEGEEYGHDSYCWRDLYEVNTETSWKQRLEGTLPVSMEPIV